MYMYYTSKLRKSIHQLHCVAVGSVTIKYLCIFRYLNSGLTTCTESSYWKFKKWVHVIYHKQFSISKDVEEMLRVHGREGGDGGGTKIFLHYCFPTCSKLQCFFKSNTVIIKWNFFLSFKITSTFDAPGVCVDIKIQVINVHVYIVARRFEHDKYRLIPRTSLYTVDFLSSARNWYPCTENYRFYFSDCLNSIIWKYNKKGAHTLDFKFSWFDSRQQKIEWWLHYK